MAEEKAINKEETEKEPVAPTETVVETAAEATSKEKPKTVLEEIAAETEIKTTAKKGRGKLEFKTIEATEVKPGMLIRVHQKIIDINTKGEEKERVQIFQGMVIAHKHGQELGATITVRKVSEGIGVERIYPLSMPSIVKIELVRQYQIRQARPYYLRTHKKKLFEIA